MCGNCYSPPLAPIIRPQSKQKKARDPERTLNTHLYHFFLKFTFPFEAFETYPQDVEGHHPSCAMDHLKTETDKELKRDVEKQM